VAPPVFKTYSVGYGRSCEVSLDRKWADISAFEVTQGYAVAAESGHSVGTRHARKTTCLRYQRVDAQIAQMRCNAGRRIPAFNGPNGARITRYPFWIATSALPPSSLQVRRLVLKPVSGR